MMSNYHVKTGKNSSGTEALIQVPVTYGDWSRSVASIVGNNSEATMPAAPHISCYITGMEYSRENIINPTFKDKKHVKERYFDKDTGTYTGAPGESYTVERNTPTPYKLMLNSDIWTTNTDQKLQLIEQICYMFNPSLELQTNRNYFDWTSISTVELTNLEWTNRAIPAGQDLTIDIASMSFELIIYIAPPVAIKRLGVIEKVVMGIFDGDGDLESSVLDETFLMGQRQYYTPLNYSVLLIDNKMQIVENNEPLTGGTEEDVDFDHIPTKYGAPIPWPQVIEQYGNLNEGTSQIKLLQYIENADVNQVFPEVVGTVALDPVDETILIFTVDTDTIPVNDLSSVDAVINPLKKGPGSGLPAVSSGQRYLILDDIGDTGNSTGGATLWPGTEAYGLVANRNDIIEYNGSEWIVSFDSQASTGLHYVVNTNTGIQYKWDTAEWIMSYQGEYQAGHWSILLTP
jgi:hypothetical protein